MIITLAAVVCVNFPLVKKVMLHILCRNNNTNSVFIFLGQQLKFFYVLVEY
jgi:hypothetical protein